MKYISECNIFSLPSWEEGFGIVYLEAMGCGKPVIACKGQGISDVLVDKENGVLVEPRSVTDVLNALGFLINNPSEAKKIGDRARSVVFQNYTLDNISKKIVNVYIEAIH
jgi:glycosyltransferase involved in cell wall biosynthesis